VDEADPKLKEFLEVMQPASKSKNWATQTMDDPMTEPPTKIQAIEVPEAESDEEYEAVPEKSRQKSPPKATVPTPTVVVPAQPAVVDEVILDSTAPDATDDDWLRGRTNRLLDLMDPEDIAAATNGPASADGSAMAEMTTEPLESMDVEMTPAVEQDNEQNDEEKPDPVIEAIRSNGRLFVRNLPYTASEDDLRKQFEPFGLLEEVRQPVFRYNSYAFMMNIQIGTAYAYEHVM
jgi:multiple RNA-binding domain-containing protein 1